jgi:hypothetical protein
LTPLLRHLLRRPCRSLVPQSPRHHLIVYLRLHPLFQRPKSLPSSLILPQISKKHFLLCQSFKTEAKDLKLWLKGQKGKVTGDWLVRVQCLSDLLEMQLLNTSKGQDARRMDWVKYSEALARRVKRSTRWASYLRQWKRDWFEIRSPPPCPHRGRHVRRKSLFFDEGVARPLGSA